MSFRIHIAFFLWSLVVVANAGAADSYLSVEMYPVSENAYDGSTPINAILRTPKKSILGSPKCFPVFVESYREEDQVCPLEWTPFYERCENQITEAIQRTPSSDVSDPRIQIVRLNRNGGAVMSIRSFFGGSGGGRYDWSLYLLRWDGKEKPQCPSVPFMTGVEVVPGGNVWVETYCQKNEPTNACVERIFYPKGNAFRLEFGAAGTHISPVLSGSKLPVK